MEFVGIDQNKDICLWRKGFELEHLSWFNLNFQRVLLYYLLNSSLIISFYLKPIYELKNISHWSSFCFLVNSFLLSIFPTFQTLLTIINVIFILALQIFVLKGSFFVLFHLLLRAVEDSFSPITKNRVCPIVVYWQLS